MSSRKRLSAFISILLTTLVGRAGAIRRVGGLGSTGPAGSQHQDLFFSGSAHSGQPLGTGARTTVSPQQVGIGAPGAQHAPQVLGTSRATSLMARYDARLAEDTEGTLPTALPTASDLGFPEELKNTFANPQYLSTGSFGMVWSVVHGGKPRVVKLLHDGSNFLTWQHVSPEYNTSFIRHERAIIDAAVECETSQNMRQYGPASDPGIEYIMACYESNIGKPYTSENEALYLVLENCGEENLQQFMTRRLRDGWTPELVMEIYVELLEALAYLGRHPKKWVHHDLNPLNIAIGMTAEGKVKLRLIDFGSAVEGKWVNQWMFTSSTPAFAPIEWNQVTSFRNGSTVFKRRSNFAVCGGVDDGRCPQSFDMYSASAIFVDLIIGHTPKEVFEGALGQAIKNPTVFVRGLLVNSAHEVTSKAFKEDGTFFNKVLVKAAECLDDDAAKRPTAKEMLAFIRALS